MPTEILAERRARPAGFVDRGSRSALLAQLERIEHGEITVIEGGVIRRFGNPGWLRATVTVEDPAFYRETALGGSLGAAESYLDNHWNCDDLSSLCRILVRNADVMDSMETGMARVAAAAARKLFRLHRNTLEGSRKNIQEHYDLGNDFFRLFLDETMTYSCGIFERPESSMREASVEKIDRVCRKLRLSPSDHLLEIGTGWGAFAIHAATRYGCCVTSTTISEQQLAWSQRMVKEAGIEDRITLLFEDYRNLRGTYDKLVSVEMIEAVGREYLGDYFAACRRLLQPGGVFALQGIFLAEHRYEQYCRQVDFIQRFVFPGSFIPSRGAVAAACEGRFAVVHEEDITPHYAETLRRWRAAFHANADEVRKLGYPERFLRLWHYYFCYCEAAFEERNCMNFQLLLGDAA